jgi:hypothetical protein
VVRGVPSGSRKLSRDVRNVAKSRENDVEEATEDDAKQREVLALSPGGDAVEAALAEALARAAEAGQFDVVAQLARELEARWLARAGNVVPLSAERGKRRSSPR